ncbi:MAG: hypothetical protein L6U16_13440 [Porphyromonadaceae bacterium]|nr:MAG: hypothetical protein L6U16_13440 [Porphyromonadaceae bacterium]
MDKATKPLIDSIEDAIETAKKTKNKGPEARLQAGEKLMTDTKSDLSQLKKSSFINRFAIPNNRR